MFMYTILSPLDICIHYYMNCIRYVSLSQNGWHVEKYVDLSKCIYAFEYTSCCALSSTGNTMWRVTLVVLSHFIT